MTILGSLTFLSENNDSTTRDVDHPVDVKIPRDDNCPRGADPHSIEYVWLMLYYFTCLHYTYVTIANKTSLQAKWNRQTDRQVDGQT